MWNPINLDDSWLGEIYINLRNQTDVILLDFKKEFDSVPHERLLTKLHY
jgi:hypothetical protein